MSSKTVTLDGVQYFETDDGKTKSYTFKLPDNKKVYDCSASDYALVVKRLNKSKSTQRQSTSAWLEDATLADIMYNGPSVGYDEVLCDLVMWNRTDHLAYVWSQIPQDQKTEDLCRRVISMLHTQDSVNKEIVKILRDFNDSFMNNMLDILVDEDDE